MGSDTHPATEIYYKSKESLESSRSDLSYMYRDLLKGKFRPYDDYAKIRLASSIQAAEIEIDSLLFRFIGPSDKINELYDTTIQISSLVDNIKVILYSYVPNISRTSSLDKLTDIRGKRIKGIARYETSINDLADQILRLASDAIDTLRGAEMVEVPPMEAERTIHVTVHGDMASDPEELADLLADLSDLYRSAGGEGIEFRLDALGVEREEAVPV